MSSLTTDAPHIKLKVDRFGCGDHKHNHKHEYTTSTRTSTTTSTISRMSPPLGSDARMKLKISRFGLLFWAQVVVFVTFGLEGRLHWIWTHVLEMVKNIKFYGRC
ncbi:hypothetical protein F503_03317 [Ophiostoma piceae UAMH 11346]|uniref:Uncharacterized protein n=1 Tax=Ophiostoma piceae (strain UAMH 11346) TaxID=1262450 RepID=S3D0V8_OPHP1|nr:hypothetical protein F503_03317 [Ophiostoma piceae UAMH 11346]